MYETFQEFLEMGPLQPLLFPEFSSGLLPKETEKIKRYMKLMDSMTNEELDRPNLKLIKEPRLVQIAGACGYPVSDALEMLELHKQLAKDWRRNEIPKNTSPFVSKSHARQIGDAAGLQRLIVAANGLS